MNNKYKDKYRIPSARLESWDYGSDAAYFVTVCTKNREHFFGEIINGEMRLNELGRMVKIEWGKSVELRPDMNLLMDEYVVMPNHFHGIIIIGKNQYNDRTFGDDCRDAMHCVSTSNSNKFGPQSKNLVSVMRGFKSTVTTFARKNGNSDIQWQSRYHDHIIRNNKSFENIHHYIINNPRKWEEDKFYL